MYPFGYTISDPTYLYPEGSAANRGPSCFGYITGLVIAVSIGIKQVVDGGTRRLPIFFFPYQLEPQANSHVTDLIQN